LCRFINDFFVKVSSLHATIMSFGALKANLEGQIQALKEQLMEANALRDKEGGMKDIIVD
jgi:hypothetical protein